MAMGARKISDLGKACGDYHGMSKLSDADVERIRRLHEHGVSYGIIARCYDVSKETIGRICRHERRNVCVFREG